MDSATKAMTVPISGQLMSKLNVFQCEYSE